MTRRVTLVLGLAILIFATFGVVVDAAPKSVAKPKPHQAQVPKKKGRPNKPTKRPAAKYVRIVSVKTKGSTTILRLDLKIAANVTLEHRRAGQKKPRIVFRNRRYSKGKHSVALRGLASTRHNVKIIARGAKRKPAQASVNFTIKRNGAPRPKPQPAPPHPLRQPLPSQPPAFLNAPHPQLMPQANPNALCRAGVLADRFCTPGKAFSIDPLTQLPLRAKTVCGWRYAANHRDVDWYKRRMVYDRYGIAYPIQPRSYNIDHLIPLKLGGSNEIENLWPEPHPKTGTAAQKYDEERQLIDWVCVPSISGTEADRRLGVAQRAMIDRWSTHYGGAAAAR